MGGMIADGAGLQECARNVVLKSIIPYCNAKRKIRDEFTQRTKGVASRLLATSGLM